MADDLNRKEDAHGESGGHDGMGMRGVTRPMEEMKQHGHGGHDHDMSNDDRHHMLRMQHKWRWRSSLFRPAPNRVVSKLGQISATITTMTTESAARGRIDVTRPARP